MCVQKIYDKRALVITSEPGLEDGMGFPLVKLDNGAGSGGYYMDPHSYSATRVARAFLDCYAQGSDDKLRAFAEDILREVNARAVPVAAKPVGPTKKKPQGFLALSPQAQKIVQHMRKNGQITAREAMADYGMASGTLTRRITDISEAGFEVKKHQREHPVTGQKYTRYTLAE